MGDDGSEPYSKVTIRVEPSDSPGYELVFYRVEGFLLRSDNELAPNPATPVGPAGEGLRGPDRVRAAHLTATGRAVPSERDGGKIGDYREVAGADS